MDESPPTPKPPAGDPHPVAPDRPPPVGDESGVGEALRAAVERTMEATAGSAATTRERAVELVDEVVRRGRETRNELARRGQGAREELARRGQEAGAELARRGQGATGEIARRLEQLERRLGELERSLGPEPPPAEPRRSTEADPKPKAED
jgi:polyhydroxyalkanoate synthesis regulator phasin